MIVIITSETPYNVRETPKASDTKPGVETRSAAELIALGMVRIQRIMFFLLVLHKRQKWAIRG